MEEQILIEKIKALGGITQEERAYLINLVNTKKKYGLVWEDKPEDVEEQLRDALPVVKEVKDRAVLNGEKYPNHILIEGDNLHALTALTFTHEGKIDVIYIDPPYNTGNKDFKYNDSFVDREDSYRHSKWLSFMGKRLQIAKRLLSEKGVIFISIDDNEQSQLKLLCDEIFSEQNFIGNIVWQHSIQGKNDAKTISLHHNYTLVYGTSLFQIGKVPRTDDHNKAYSNPDNDPNGMWRSGDVRSPNYRENLCYTIVTPSGKKIKPPENGWRWEEPNLYSKIKTGEIIFNKEETKIVRKIYLNKQEGRVPESIWFGKEVGTTREATALLKEMFGEAPFDTPKPIGLLSRILQIAGNNNAVVLDFFAGSGTTLHATIHLNTEDGGNRKCIMVTNNENNIAEEVCYERNRRVIQGYTNAKGEKITGLGSNNLRYYRCDFVSRDPSIKNKRELTKLATELLCIKEDVYTEVKLLAGQKLSVASVRCFQRDHIYLLMIYTEEVIEQMVEAIRQTVQQKEDRNIQFKIYVFSNGQYPYTEEFEEVLPYITLCALPDAIYKAYTNVLPARKKNMVAASSVQVGTSKLQSALFDE